MEANEKELAYLGLLARQYPSIQAASTTIIALNAQLNLPKGTEHFISDIHGEYEAFRHVLKNGSGSIKRKIDENFGHLSESEKRNLATLIYYPEQKTSLILPTVADEAEWYHTTLLQLIQLCRIVSSKYTRATMESFLPSHLATIIEELLQEQETIENRYHYYEGILETIISTGSGKTFIVALAELIQQLAIARLHVIGDVYDRGPGAHLIMDTLMDYHHVDIQWGNHDILWMGAAAGSEALIASVIRICLRYANLETLEQGYGISLLPLGSLAMDLYGDDPCEQFLPKSVGEEEFTEHELRLMAQMHKAISIIQFKLEAEIIRRRPHYQMTDRLLLDKIDYERGVIHLNGKEYALLDTHFPTIDPAHPYKLTEREETVVKRLKLSFANSSSLQRHIRFLYSKGGMYLVYNGNLLYHGCIPINEDGSFRGFEVGEKKYTAKDFMDRLDRLARQGYFATDDPAQKQYGLDTLWYLWTGAQSPIFGKDKMATFERYFIAEEETHTEIRNPYYEWRNEPAFARKILAEFGVAPETGHIVNGHVPVKVRKGESPVKAGGKLLVIDGGFAKAYQKVTGIAGYTLISNSYGLLLASHHPFESTQRAIEEELDIDSKTEILQRNDTRIRVGDTDEGREIKQQIADLQRLLKAYRSGLIKEK